MVRNRPMEGGFCPRRMGYDLGGEGMAIGSHQSAKMLNDEWLTPHEILSDLGPFDLDPCSPINRPWLIARHHFTINDNGLLQNWFGFVWCNPPYGKYTEDWLQRSASHNNGIVLIFARTETKMWFRYIWSHAHSILFIEGRLTFYHVDGTKAKANGGAPSVLVAYGLEADKRLSASKIKGKYIKLK